MTSVENPYETAAPAASNKTTTGTGLLCVYCNLAFQTKWSYYAHNRKNNHPKPIKPRTPYYCSHCQTHFKSKYILAKHLWNKHHELISQLDTSSPNDINSKNDESLSTDENFGNPNDDQELPEDQLTDEQFTDHCYSKIPVTTDQPTEKLPLLKTTRLLKPKESTLLTPFFCTVCQRYFSRKNNLVRHMVNVHKLQEFSPDIISLDNAEDSLESVLDNSEETDLNQASPVEEEPSIEAQIPRKTLRTFVFATSELFQEWKSKVERETVTRFVSVSGASKRQISQVKYYRCHRSGHYKPNTTGKRKLKTKGSVKIGARCGAYMKVETFTVARKNMVRVGFNSCHTGHEVGNIRDIGHMALSRQEKTYLAGELARGVSMADILNDVRVRFPETDRLHYTNRKDLHNIVSQFGINSVERV